MGWFSGRYTSSRPYNRQMSGGGSGGARQSYTPSQPYIQQMREGGGPSAPPPAKNPPVKRP